jgi:hypothetical protein
MNYEQKENKRCQPFDERDEGNGKDIPHDTGSSERTIGNCKV